MTTLLSASMERPLPVWLSIGLAEVYGNTSVRDKEVHVGRPVPWHLRQFNERARQPLPAILAAQHDTPLLLKDNTRASFDAQCWALVHYLSFADQGAHARELGRFIQLWLAGRPQNQAWAESFGDVKSVESKLLAYSTQPIMSFGRLLADVNLERRRLPVRPLVPAETAALRATVHVAMGRPVEAQAAVEEARTADRKSPASYDAEGLLADRERDKARADQAYGQAVELGSTSAYSYYRAAQLAWKPQADPETRTAIRKQLERAIELNGLYAPAYSYLADVMVQQDQAAAALPMAQRALALEPGATYHHFALANVLYKLGEPPRRAPRRCGGWNYRRASTTARTPKAFSGSSTRTPPTSSSAPRSRRPKPGPEPARAATPAPAPSEASPRTRLAPRATSSAPVRPVKSGPACATPGASHAAKA